MRPTAPLRQRQHDFAGDRVGETETAAEILEERAHLVELGNQVEARHTSEEVVMFATDAKLALAEAARDIASNEAADNAAAARIRGRSSSLLSSPTPTFSAAVRS